jgi:WD40 repeat protein
MWIQKVRGGGVQFLAYAPDGRTLYTLDGGGWVTAWDVTTRTGSRLFKTYPTQPGFCSRFEVGDNGRFLLAFGVHNLTNFRMPHPGEWLIWDLEANAERGRLVSEADVYGTQPEPDAPTIVVIGSGTERRWDYTRGAFTPDVGNWMVPEQVRFVALSADRRLMAVAGASGSVYLVVLSHYGPAQRLGLPDPVFGGCLLQFSPDGNALAVIYPGRLLLWDLEGRQVRATVLICGARVGFHPTAPMFAALNRDKVLTLFDLDTGEPLRSLDFALGRYVQSACFSPDGLTCAVGGSNKQFAVFDVDL